MLCKITEEGQASMSSKSQLSAVRVLSVWIIVKNMGLRATHYPSSNSG